MQTAAQHALPSTEQTTQGCLVSWLAAKVSLFRWDQVRSAERNHQRKSMQYCCFIWRRSRGRSPVAKNLSAPAERLQCPSLQGPSTSVARIGCKIATICTHGRFAEFRRPLTRISQYLHTTCGYCFDPKSLSVQSSRYSTAGLGPMAECGWCQTNSNPSLQGQRHCPLIHEETAPLSQSGGTVEFEIGSR